MKSIGQYLRLSVLLIFALSLFNCGGSKVEATTENKRVFPVEVVPVVRGNVENKIAYLGNLEAYRNVKVYSTIPTKITELKVDVNDVVKEGDLLAVVDNVKIKQGVLQAEAGLKSAQAQYENMQTEWKRIQKLYKQNAVSQSQYDAVKTQKEAAEAAVNQMKAGLQSAREQLKDSYIKAPISGIISSRNYNVGDQTSPQLPVFSIVQMDRIKIKIDIVESQASMVYPGLKAYIKVDTYPGEVFMGKVDKVYPIINPLTRTITAEIMIDNSDRRLKPGGFARVEIVTTEHENVLVIPKHAVIEKTTLKYLGGGLSNSEIKTDYFVFIVQDSIALMKKIQTGLSSDNKVEVSSGLKMGDLVVTIGQYNISDSSLVQIVGEGK